MNHCVRLTQIVGPFLRLISKIWLLLIVVLSSAALGQAPRLEPAAEAARNLDIEDGILGEVPVGWTLPSSAKEAGYEVQLTEDNPQSGKRCVLLRSKSNIPTGTLMQTVDARPYRGKQARFRAYARTGSFGVAGQAQLWMRVERRNAVGFFDSMVDRPIQGAEWNLYEIVGDVDEDAEAISFGFLVRWEGNAWFDSASLEAVPGSRISKEAARPISERGIENIASFGKLYGYVRYFHPSDEAANVNWNQFVVNNVRRVEGSRSASELSETLQAIFHPIAPTVRVFVSGHNPPLPTVLLRPPSTAAKVIFWSHHGYGPGDISKSYHSERLIMEVETEHHPRNVFRADLGGGVSAMVPLALWTVAKGDKNQGKSVALTTRSPIPPSTFRDRATRLATTIIAWNIFQHFYSYFDVVKTDWSSVLKTSLRRAAIDADGPSFLTTLQRLTAQLHDAHATVSHSFEGQRFKAPIEFDFIENRLIITRVGKEIQDIHPGDVVLAIDGQTTETLIQRQHDLCSAATEGWLQWYTMLFLSLGEENTKVLLEAESATGQHYKKTLVRNVPLLPVWRESELNKFTELKPGIFYVDLTDSSNEDLDAILPKIEKAKGIIFDFRGYPRFHPKFFGHFTDEKMVSPQFHVPQVSRPDREKLVFETNPQWSVEPLAPRIRTKNIFLIERRAVSAAETFLSFVQHYKLGTFVGQQTAGTNGTINRVLLPGGFTMSWSGMKVLNQDGSQHHGIGFRPTVPVTRTIKGVAEGRDEILEEATKVLTRQIASPDTGGSGRASAREHEAKN